VVRALLLALGVVDYMGLGSSTSDQFERDLADPIAIEAARDQKSESLRETLQDETTQTGFYAEHVHLPHGAEWTAGLLENVFAEIACFRIPLYIEGPEGTGKTRSVRLLEDLVLLQGMKPVSPRAEQSQPRARRSRTKRRRSRGIERRHKVFPPASQWYYSAGGKSHRRNGTLMQPGGGHRGLNRSAPRK